MKTLLIMIIKFYRAFISPILGSNCRFNPTCSQYSLSAIEKYGAFKGSRLSIKRIMKCHPFHAGGYDPLE